MQPGRPRAAAVPAAVGAASRARKATGGACQQRHLATAAVYVGPLTLEPEPLDPSHHHSSLPGVGRGAKAVAGGTCEQRRVTDEELLCTDTGRDLAIEAKLPVA